LTIRVAVLVGLALAATAVAAQPARTLVPAAAVFDQVSKTVEEKFYDPKLRGVDWTALKAQYRPLVAAAATEAERAALVNRMLEALGTSHTGYFVPSDRAYYDLLVIFAGNFRDELKRMFPNGEVSYTGIGVFTREVGGKVFVAGVLEGFPAEKAGLHVGDEIVAVAGRPFTAVEAFAGQAGASVPLAVRRTARGPVEQLTVVPERILPGRAFLSAMERSARVIVRGGRRIGYIHVWSYAGAHVQELLEREAYSGALKDADALIWDLRDGWGGAQVEYLDMFTARGPVLALTNRSGKQTIENVKWRQRRNPERQGDPRLRLQEVPRR
jgi:carboxyl-terminal processing protease